MATYGAGIRIDTSVSSATYSTSGSGTVYTVPSDSFIVVTVVEAAKGTTPVTQFNFYINGAKIETGTSNGSLVVPNYVAGPGSVISYDTTGGSGTVYGKVYFTKFFNS